MTALLPRASGPRRNLGRRGRRRTELGMIAAIALGGAVGALARYGIGQALPSPAKGFPWATFLINATGCLVIGVVMVLILQVGMHRLIRPFLGVGVLGGYTTFSTYVVDVQRLVDGGTGGIALAYLVATPVAALLAVTAGSALARAALRPHPKETA